MRWSFGCWLLTGLYVDRSSGFSGGGSGGGCSWTLCPPRFRSDGGDGAVAALVGSDTAPLSELNYSGLVSPCWTWTVYVRVGFLLVSFS